MVKSASEFRRRRRSNTFRVVGDAFGPTYFQMIRCLLLKVSEWEENLSFNWMRARDKLFSLPRTFALSPAPLLHLKSQSALSPSPGPPWGTATGYFVVPSVSHRFWSKIYLTPPFAAFKALVATKAADGLGTAVRPQRRRNVRLAGSKWSLLPREASADQEGAVRRVGPEQIRDLSVQKQVSKTVRVIPAGCTNRAL